MHRKRTTPLVQRIITLCLFFLLAFVPLILNPFAVDFFYKPKIHSVYALLIIIITLFSFPSLFLSYRPDIRKNILAIPLCLYAVSACISTVFSVDIQKSLFGDALREESVFALLSYAGLALVFSTFIGSRQQALRFFAALLGTTVLISCYALLQYFWFDPTEHFIPVLRYAGPGVGSTLGNPNFLGKFMVLVLPVFFVFFLNAETPLKTVATGLGMLLGVSALVVSYTRASWLGFCMSIVVFFVFRRDVFKNCSRKISALVLLVVLCGGLIVGNMARHESGREFLAQRVSSTFDLQKGEGSGTRLFIWKRAFYLVLNRPVFGYGPDAHVTALRQISRDYGQEVNQVGILDRCHNNYLDLAIGQGLFGLGSYLAVIITFLLHIWRRSAREDDVHQKRIYCGIFAAMCGYCVNDFFIFSVVSVSPTFWAVIGLTLAFGKGNNG